jgi:hypothetical protein
MMQINHLRWAAPKEGGLTQREDAKKWLKRRLQRNKASREGEVADWSRMADKAFERGFFGDIRS